MILSTYAWRSERGYNEEVPGATIRPRHRPGSLRDSRAAAASRRQSRSRLASRASPGPFTCRCSDVPVADDTVHPGLPLGAPSALARRPASPHRVAPASQCDVLSLLSDIRPGYRGIDPRLGLVTGVGSTGRGNGHEPLVDTGWHRRLVPGRDRGRAVHRPGSRPLLTGPGSGRSAVDEGIRRARADLQGPAGLARAARSGRRYCKARSECYSVR